MILWLCEMRTATFQQDFNSRAFLLQFPKEEDIGQLEINSWSWFVDLHKSQEVDQALKKSLTIISLFYPFHVDIYRIEVNFFLLSLRCWEDWFALLLKNIFNISLWHAYFLTSIDLR